MPDLIFCPYCGHQTVDAGPQRTYCTTCGEDIVTPAQVEDLEDELAQAKKDLEAAERCLKSAEDDLVKEEKKVLDQSAALRTAVADLVAKDDLLAEARDALESVLTGPVNLPARIVEKVIAVHRRLL